MYCIRKVFALNNQSIDLITIENKNKMQVQLLNYGATIVSILTPNKKGELENVVLTYEKFEDYIKNPVYFGCTIGRTSGRIAEGIFTLDGKKYHLNKNFGENHCHGGWKGFSFQVWDYTIKEDKNKQVATFTYTSKDMEEGYPGNLQVKVIYTLTNDNRLVIEYEGKTDKKTLCNLTNHTYFNLSGNYKRKVTQQLLKIKANKFLEVKENLIPTGNILDVKNTPMDFTELKKIGEDIEKDYYQLKIAKGYDHTWLLEDKENQIEMIDELSGRKMIINTTYPSVVVYTYNSANNEKLMYGKIGSKHDGICFETQYQADGINHEGFPSAILDKGQKYYEKTEMVFSII